VEALAGAVDRVERCRGNTHVVLGVGSDECSAVAARLPGCAPREAGMVMTVEFELDGQPFVGINGGPEFKFDEAVSFQITCETQDDVDYYWDTLTEGGEEGPCGWLKDRFGLSWQVVPTGMEEIFSDPDPKRAERAMKAMLGMKKLDIAALRSAADGVPVG
jgi:predicted 3-demethylubiquinone-9 3-methyltransferase (glyoxalase superfamily)